jgi:hypothetical protein
MALYINWPFFLVTLGGGLLVAYLWNIGDKDPAKVVALIAAVAAVAYIFTAAPLRDLEISGFDRSPTRSKRCPTRRG